MTELDKIDDLTPQFRPVFNDLCARLWTMLGDGRVDEYTGVVTVQGGNFQIGLVDRETNLAAMNTARERGGAGGAEADDTIARLRLRRTDKHLRLLIVAPQAVLVLDAPNPRV